MTPTQAQIEAAARTIRERWIRMLPVEARATAQAALTAAAEAGPDYNIDDAPEATAVRLATIERCAQVAENVRPCGTVRLMRESIAAAIRAMKEEP